MISYLEGTIKFKGPNYLILVTSGVGYKVFVPLDLLTNCPLAERLSLFAYTYVRKEALDLYGFSTREELALFEMLLKVPGIGPKIALSIFSNGKLENIKQAIVRGDVDFFSQVPRLGKRNAQKIIIELRPKLGSLEEIDLTQETAETKEIIEALKTFGFSLPEVKEAMQALRDFTGSTSEKIREALRYLGKGK